MRSLPVVETLDVIESFRFNLFASLKMFTVCSLDLDPGKEAFNYGIIPAVPFSKHVEITVADLIP